MTMRDKKSKEKCSSQTLIQTQKNCFNLAHLVNSLIQQKNCQKTLQKYNRLDLHEIAYIIQEENQKLKKQCEQISQYRQQDRKTMDQLLEQYQNKEAVNEFQNNYDEALQKYLHQLQTKKQTLHQIQEQNLQLRTKFKQLTLESEQIQKRLKQKLVVQTNENIESIRHSVQLDQQNIEDILTELYSKVQNTLQKF